MSYTNSPLVSFIKLSPNNSGARTHAIDRITPHCVVGQCSVETLGNIFADPAKQASSNYGIGPDGRVGMYVEEKNRSWCSSNGENDNRAVTIECASDTYEPYAFKETVYNRLIELCVDICRRNGKSELLWLGSKEKTLAYTPKAGEMILTVHRWFANKSCPGAWLMERMGELAAKVTEKLGGDTPEPEPDTCRATVTLPILRYDPQNDSPYVTIAQYALIIAGYNIKYGADGYFGGATRAAVEDFQQKNGLPVTGIIDGPTWAALLK